MAGSVTKEGYNENTLVLVFSDTEMTPEEVDEMKESIKQSQIKNEKRIRKYRDLMQKDIVSIFGENHTPEELKKYSYITVENIRTTLYDRLTGRYSEECIQELDFFSNDVLIIMKKDGLLESKWFACHGGEVYPQELSYKLSEEGINLFQTYLKEKKHKDALEVLNPF